MFYFASKLLWFLLSPVNLLLVVALGALWLRRRGVAALCLIALLAIGFAPIGAWMIAPLEDRFSRPPADAPAPYGIIVLGGAIDEELSLSRGATSIVEGAERLTEAVVLARRYPDARVVYTGGTVSLRGARSNEAAAARELLVAMGIAPERILIETQSRNTDENARLTADLVHPLDGQRWLLVTSAWHMTRSMGLFRKAGFDVAAFPVDYRSPGPTGRWDPDLAPFRGLRTFDLAVHEWVGLTAYRLTGRIDSWFPAP
jgi:uncharacterized SAM-binding protein YcdF (DUF218 family)